MYFKRLEMHGFKSFAEPVVIEFHEGVTAVVGPNGSGKSNISDAIRWVLGEQSPKALRGGKMEEVIFAGTASRKSRGMAEVTLVIDNSMGILPIDYNEVAITRRMFRSGESEYMINNHHCRLRDIRELIMDTGIGVDGYSLIGQGKIADIVSNKPESRREIFEEAAGVVMYKSKKAEAERKLSNTNQNLERANDIIGEIESRIDGLREDSIKATEYLELKERYQDLEINITLKNIESIIEKNEIYRQDITQFTKELEDYQKAKKEVDAQVEADREKNDELEQLGNQARDKLLQLVEDVNKLTNESQLNEERISAIERDHQRILSEITQLEEKLTKEQNNAKEQDAEKTAIQEKFELAESTLSEKVEVYSEVSKASMELSKAMEDEKDRYYRLHNSISGKKSEIRSYNSIKEALDKRKRQIEEELSSAEQNKVDTEQQLTSAKADMTTYRKTIEDAEQQLQAYHAEKTALTAKHKETRLHVEDLKLQGGQKVARKKTIEEMESNYEGYNYAVKYIMRAGLAGIEGVVADLMQVPSGFETAIETALGAQMQNIVCATDQDAKRAVNKLKENNAGRLTFLPVASIKGARAKVDGSLTQAKGYKGLAADCIQFDSKYEHIFSYLLGRVAIVDNMDTAIQLSKTGGNGLRFVTMDGEIINVSGAITGGRYKNKTANLLERKGEIAKLAEEIETLRNEMLAANRKDEEDRVRLSVIEEEMQKLEEVKREAELTKAALQSSITAIEDVVNNFDADRKKAEGELQAIEHDLDSADQTVTTLRHEIDQGLKEITAIDNASAELMEAYETKEAEVKAASEEITAARIATNQWLNKRTHIEDVLNMIQASIDDYEFQIQEKQQALSALDEEKNQILFGTDDREAHIDDMMKEKQEIEGYIQAVAEERSQLHERIERVSKEQQEAGARLNACQDQKYQLEIKVAKNDTQMDSLKEKLWEDFEISYAQALDFKREDFVLSTFVKESRDIRNRIRALGDVNISSINEYESVSQRYEFLKTQREDILTAMDELKKIITDMDNTIKDRFKTNFDQIVENFEDIFKELFGGGHAELRMEDENNPLESGIDIIAQPPGKKLQNINLMSGGEKTMTAIALMFAVLKTKPTPFCILDEVEAALDDANIDRFAKYLRKFENIQFTLVTHQKATMEHADVLYGVTMPEHGISRVLSLRLGDNFDL